MILTVRFGGIALALLACCAADPVPVDCECPDGWTLVCPPEAPDLGPFGPGPGMGCIDSPGHPWDGEAVCYAGVGAEDTWLAALCVRTASHHGGPWARP